ncbi:hypothetical protein ACQZV8_19535 [Magnetococcales bacterium HHB-1]
MPSPPFLSSAFNTLNITPWVVAPNPWFFGSFLLLPSLFILGMRARGGMRLFFYGMLLYLFSVLFADILQTPSEGLNDMGFRRSWGIPLFSGFTVAMGLALLNKETWRLPVISVLHRVYGVVFVGSCLALVILIFGEEVIRVFAAQHIHLDNPENIQRVFDQGPMLFGATAISLILYFWIVRLEKNGAPRRAVIWLLPISVACMGTGYSFGWYHTENPKDLLIPTPEEIIFLQKRNPDFQYRVGYLEASGYWEMRGDLVRRIEANKDPHDDLIRILRIYNLRMRTGLASVMPRLHFYHANLIKVRMSGNHSAIHNNGDRNLMIDPDAQALADYGCRYWVTNLDLDTLYPSVFKQVFNGPYARIYERHDATPIAHMIADKGRALPITNTMDRLSIGDIPPEGGVLTIRANINDFSALSISPDGHEVPISLMRQGERWEIHVPPGTHHIDLVANEFGIYMVIIGICLALFAGIMGWLAMVGRRS